MTVLRKSSEKLLDLALLWFAVYEMIAKVVSRLNLCFGMLLAAIGRRLFRH
jgi:hypothetical protein